MALLRTLQPADWHAAATGTLSWHVFCGLSVLYKPAQIKAQAQASHAGPCPPVHGSPAPSSTTAAPPACGLRRHGQGGPAQVVDFQWHPEEPYTMMSVSEEDAGGTLQLWRICDLVTKPEKDVLAELDKHRRGACARCLPPALLCARGCACCCTRKHPCGACLVMALGPSAGAEPWRLPGTGKRLLM